MSFNELMDMIREEQDRIELDLNDVNEAIEILDNGTGFRYLWKEGKYDTIYKLAGKFKIFVSQEFLHDVSNNSIEDDWQLASTSFDSTRDQ